jgi:hypothetical protein
MDAQERAEEAHAEIDSLRLDILAIATVDDVPTIKELAGRALRRIDRYRAAVMLPSLTSVRGLGHEDSVYRQ